MCCLLVALERDMIGQVTQNRLRSVWCHRKLWGENRPLAQNGVERGMGEQGFLKKVTSDFFLEGRKIFDPILVETFAGVHEGLGLGTQLL